MDGAMADHAFMHVQYSNGITIR